MNSANVREGLVNQAVDHTLRVIDRKYGNLPFHNRQHTEDVLGRTEKILWAVTSGRENLLDLGRIAAAFHDVERGSGAPANERISGEQAEAWMNGCNAGRPGTFTDEDMRLVIQAIMATVPKWLPDGSFEQPHLFEPSLSSASRLVASALALADVGVAGIAGFEPYKSDGDRLFREKNSKVQEELACLHKRADLSGKEKDIDTALRGWLRKQVTFATDLGSAYMSRVLALLDEQSRQIISGLFNKWQGAIEESKERLQRGQNQDLWTIAEDMGFRVPPVG
jgi:hypothetical protein